MLENTKIIVTIGPKSIEENILVDLKKAGASAMRINLSHSNTESLDDYYTRIQKQGLMPSIDTQGAQLRVEEIPDKATFVKNEEVRLKFKNEKNKTEKTDDKLARIIFNHPEASNQLEVEDILKVDFNGLIITTKKRIGEYEWIGKVKAKGNVIKNRAVDIHGKTLDLAPLTEFDRKAIKYAQDRGCKEIYASFISSSDDVKEVRSHLCKETRLISKIETAKGVSNALDIMKSSDAVLIDRGDLSREISIPSIPIAVLSIIDIARKCECPVYIATNILDSMMTAQLPSRAEISDIYTLLTRGVSGLVLAAEVAIGDNPVQSTALLEYLGRLYRNHVNGLHGIGEVRKPERELIGEQLYNWL